MSETDEGAPRSAPPDLRVSELDVGDQEMVVFSFDATARRSEVPLTGAEREVLMLLLAGRSNREIARTRATSERTTANQIASIFRKLDVHSRAELLAAMLPPDG
jgi:DNA-binding CsgD family transcriptional regulator